MIAQCLCLCVVCECAQARGDLPYLALGDHQTYTIPTKPCPPLQLSFASKFNNLCTSDQFNNNISEQYRYTK